MYVIGIDCGTTSLKGIVMNQKGEVLNIASKEYPMYHPNVGYSEQNPIDWYEACIEVLVQLFKENTELKTKCSGISFSGQMHSLVLLDKDNEIIRPAILWNDVRTSEEVDYLNTNHLPLLLEVTNNRAVEGFTLPKILWVQKNEPENFKRIDTILLPKDYIRYRLSNQKYMDLSDAAGTMMLDVQANIWSTRLADTFGYEISWLPPLSTSEAFCGNLTDEIKNKIGAEVDIPLFAGGADNACAALGSGIIDDKTGMLSIGTSGVFLSSEYKPLNYDGKMHLFNHAVPTYYYSMGVTLAAGDAMKWIRSILNPEKSYEELLKNVASIPCGSEGLLFTPYLNGERTPHFDATIRGSFIGLDTHHTANHLLRSVMEGITFSIKDSYMLSKSLKEDTLQRIVSVGGGAKNPTWLQMQADILNKEILVLTQEEGPALGAAMLAAMGSKWFSSFEECIETCVHYKQSYKPIQKNVGIYNDFYNLYTEVYTSQKEICKNLIALRSKKV